ncbi:hypothetical protein PAXRUDRAFT_351524 [Paxillus rubicundulus Ve08.2h10]|uniref:Transmembrane protein n=1 Tax=Paxillus rubicundulus Ve08.2h10 TaxID=930991 RepID=A0A0D0C4D9_9AGAM|nr:hypothetical protein PAXRUDRAFT_351524 [Paxillus rubicundulus Ve08.2h10]
MSGESAMSDDKAMALKIVISAASSLVVMVIEFAWLLPDELKVVWPKLCSSRYAKVYVCSRYLGISSQIANVCFAWRMYAGTPSTSTVCRMWYGFQATVVQLLLGSVEGALMHRVYALFFRNQYIFLVLALFAVCQVGSMVVSAHFAVPSGRHTETCMVIRPHPGNAYFGATTMTTNLLILFMTSWKYLRLPIKRASDSIGWVVLRDSALSLLAISIMMLFVTLCALEVITPSMSGNFSYYWLVCILWVSIGRIIVNHEKLALDMEGDSSSKGDISTLTDVRISPTSTNITGTCPNQTGTIGSGTNGTSMFVHENGVPPDPNELPIGTSDISTEDQVPHLDA